MAYTVPDLRYPYPALESHLDQALRLHHDKHHQAYEDKVTYGGVCA